MRIAEGIGKDGSVRRIWRIGRDSYGFGIVSGVGGEAESVVVSDLDSPVRERRCGFVRVGVIQSARLWSFWDAECSEW